MAHDVQVRKIVLLPRFTSFAGDAGFGPGYLVFNTAPINVREFASATVHLWIGPAIGAMSPSLSAAVQVSADLQDWETLATIAPSPNSEDEAEVTLDRDWMRLAATLGGGVTPAFTCWAVGEFVTRASAGMR